MYTKDGDRGTTGLAQTKNISKSDDRVSLIGTIDELISQLGVVKTMTGDTDTAVFLSGIQQTLLLISEGVSDPYRREYRIGDGQTLTLEQQIDRLHPTGGDREERILPGNSLLSASIDVARAVCRRAERALALVSVRYGADNGAKKYLNRLSDYLYVLARSREQDETQTDMAGSLTAPEPAALQPYSLPADPELAQAKIRDAVIREIRARTDGPDTVSLALAKSLIEKMEAEAARRGMQAVIAVCGSHGEPVAVHVMDGAYLVSFDAAVKKAYTSVAVRMSTMELSRLAQPGQTFYGVEQTDSRVVILGGGVPLICKGKIIGGLGVSGSASEEDNSLAQFGQAIMGDLL